MNSAEWSNYVRTQLGELVEGLSNEQLVETYVPTGTKFLDRSIANSKGEAAQKLSAWTRGKKSKGRPEEVYRTRTEDIGNGIAQVMLGGPLRGTANLAINGIAGDRRHAAERMLDLYLELNPELVKKELVNAAKDKYARINQILGKETHHMLEVDGTDAIINAMPTPEEKVMAAQRLLKDGFGLGDAPVNQVALYGSSNPGPAGSASTKPYEEINEHQGVLHSDQGFKAIADQFGFPSLRNSVEKGVDTSVPRWAKDDSTKAMVAGLRQLQASGPSTVEELVRRQPGQAERMSVVDMYGGLSRLAVQEARGIGKMADGNTDKNNSAIRRSLNKLDEAHRAMAGDDVADFERGFLGKLGIDLDDEILRNRSGGRRR